MTSSDLRRRMRNGCSSTLVACLLTLAAAPAVAQTVPTASDLESARALFKQGKDLRATGDPANLRPALEKFKAAHAYGQTPLTALELGRTHAAVGELVEAREVLLSIARMKVQPDETERSAAARAEAGQMAEQLRPRISTVIVKLEGDAPEGKTSLAIDGVAVVVVASEATRKLNPGSHLLVARAGSGTEERRTVMLSEGETQNVVLSPRWESPAAPVPPEAVAPDRQTTLRAGLERDPGSTARTLVLVGVATGAIGVVTGSITGVLAMSKASDVSAACPDKQRCSRASEADYDGGRTLGTVSTVSFIVAGAGVTAAVVGWLLAPTSSKRSQPQGFLLEPHLGFHLAGVHGAF